MKIELKSVKFDRERGRSGVALETFSRFQSAAITLPASYAKLFNSHQSGFYFAFTSTVEYGATLAISELQLRSIAAENVSTAEMYAVMDILHAFMSLTFEVSTDESNREILNKICQHYKLQASYSSASSMQPQHAPTWNTTIRIGGVVYGTGTGPSEASSKEMAATAAVAELRRKYNI
ncbi:hypothetical protein CVT25_010658 [Psilocybe cyanescens]|uniref:DRBM domain-containing protein n=1 Tax=Psilocybe cyanescens TaxID=93625 RepID=A0A409WJU8_PSICY|nr:hypothetical protein CVT25_010658 [Psilocybe cyanescens]